MLDNLARSHQLDQATRGQTCGQSILAGLQPRRDLHFARKQLPVKRRAVTDAFAAQLAHEFPERGAARKLDDPRRRQVQRGVGKTPVVLPGEGGKDARTANQDEEKQGKPAHTAGLSMNGMQGHRESVDGCERLAGLPATAATGTFSQPARRHAAGRVPWPGSRRVRPAPPNRRRCRLRRAGAPRGLRWSGCG